MRPIVSSLLRSSAFLLFAASMAGAQEELTVYNVIPWQRGAITAQLGTVAMVDIPDYCMFGDKKGAERFLRATQNTPSGSETGIMLCTVPGKDSSSHWFVVFSFDESGYVKDANKDTLDPAKILNTIREGQDAANEERKDRGYPELVIPGWRREPYYDTTTNNLTWSLRVRGKEEDESGESINHSVRLLGRRGVMHADLVANPADMDAAVPAFDSILTNFSYISGHSYAEWRPGDKIAKYGLTALVAGGAGLAAVKLGLFAKAWKWLLGILIALKKLAIVVVLAIVAFFKKIISWFRDRASRATSAPVPAVAGAAPVRAGRDPFKPVYPPGHPKYEAPPPPVGSPPQQ
jgi:uncharacterized membrane-anchored protein